jgi:hypothetical protein
MSIKKISLSIAGLLALLSILVGLALPDPISATNFPPGNAANTIGPMTFLSTTTSNKTSASWPLESASTHTFQIVTICTNACSNIISASLDGLSWIPLATNSVSASATNGIVMIGYRFSYLRATFGQTTAGGSTNTILYLGSRQ